MKGYKGVLFYDFVADTSRFFTKYFQFTHFVLKAVSGKNHRITNGNDTKVVIVSFFHRVGPRQNHLKLVLLVDHLYTFTTIQVSFQ